MYKSKYFNVGKTVCTNRVNELTGECERFLIEILIALQRYTFKDWGSISEEDKQVNENNLKNTDDIFLMGAYETCKGTICIMTNRATGTVGDNVTTILFPDER